MEEVKKYFKDYKSVPTFHEFFSDTLTPIQIFNILEQYEENCFILESIENGSLWGRYSFIGVHPTAEIKITENTAVYIRNGISAVTQIDNPMDFLEGIMKEHTSPVFPNYPKLTGGLIGYFGYDTIRYFEKKLCNPPKDDLNMPTIDLFLFNEIIAYDHISNKTVIIQNITEENADEKYLAAEKRAAELLKILNEGKINKPQEKKPCEKPIVTADITKEKFIENVNIAKDYIKNGDIFQVVLSRRIEVENPPKPFDVFRMLRAENPSPYMYYFKSRDFQIAGASPEMLVSVTNKVVSAKPIAGTAPRGENAKQDKAFEQALLSDKKERAEHTMLVDLGRNDVGKISKFGTVEVTEFMHVERYSKVMHLVSGVKGMLREDKTAFDALSSLLPAGTLSGAPKIRAMEIIDELETQKRGLYGGTVGYIGFDGNIDTCIAIRTVLFKNGKAYVQSGAGIVADSVPEKEFEETLNKSRAMVDAIEEAARL
ncbi:MAG: anthranilate synthase component I [Oscillospiraceae bacterium]